MLDKNFSSIEEQLKNLLFLEEELKNQTSSEERMEVLENHHLVVSFLFKAPEIASWLEKQDFKKKWAITVLIAMGQGDRVLMIPPDMKDPEPLLMKLSDALWTVEEFYREAGGLIGYQKQVLELLKAVGEKDVHPSSITFHHPKGIDIRQETEQVRRAIHEGIKRLPELAEIYPVGGAADRLKLSDPLMDDALPAAGLFFCGRLLIERLIIDLQAREYLHYKLFSSQVTTPVALMTSDQKKNHQEILKICQEKKWFGRPADSFFLFTQPGVPAMDRNGIWCLQSPLKLLLKPGGHGVIWRLARDRGIFSRLFKLGRKKAVVRQINNLIAGVDYGLLAFQGFGFLSNKSFGFASCPRLLYANEGMNVLIKKKSGEEDEYLLSNIEYCDLKKFQALDIPQKEGELTSKFPANTNILFADLIEVEKALERCFLPGMVINFRKTFSDRGEEEVVRLESTMQNIADCFGTVSASHLKTYLTHHHRRKTIAPLKRGHVAGSSLEETPEGCFLEIQENAKELLTHCGFQCSDCLFNYHPSLGPLYSIISQKLRKGKLSSGAELKLEISELDVEDLDCEGSLHILASSIMGDMDEKGLLTYSEQSGKCTLRRVTVKNRGINHAASHIFWKEEIQRDALCKILIEGNGEFFAEDVVLDGDLLIEVRANEKVSASMKDGKLHLRREPLQSPGWFWEYSVDPDWNIRLRKKDSSLMSPKV